MGAELHNIHVEKGIDFVLSLSLTQADGTIYDLNQYTLDGEIRIATSVYPLSFSEDVALGKASVVLLATDTEVFPTGVGKYEVNITEDVSGIKDRLIRGRIYVDGGAE